MLSYLPKKCLWAKWKPSSQASTFPLQVSVFGSSLHGKSDIEATYIVYFSNKPS